MVTTEPSELPKPGDLFASRYRIVGLLGKGGFGAVFHASDTSLERDVALKILMRATDEDALARFLREARASAAITSEHVATVYEVGSTSDGPYIVMELLRGSDLQDQLDDRRVLPVTEAVELVLQAALGVAHAHARGIIHRDLKPRNLFRARRDDGTDVVKVLDFGIAKQTSTDLTQTGTTMGTPRYMAPEQLRSARSVDARTDVWALGVVLYELVSGKPIFDGDTATELAVSIVIDPHIPLRQRDPALPVALEKILDRCLEKAPDARFADVHAFATALGPLASDAGRALVPRIERALGDRASVRPLARSGADDTVRARPEIDATVVAPTPAPTPAPTVEQPTRPPPRPARTRRFAVVGLVAAVVIAVIIAMAMRRSTEPVAITPVDAPPPDATHDRPPARVVVAPPDAAPPDAAPQDAAPADARTPIDAPRPEPRSGRAPSDKEIEELEGVCRTHPAPLFLIPNNDGPISMQCTRLALLGCGGITRACKTLPSTDGERQICRDFQASARAAGTCR